MLALLNVKITELTLLILNADSAAVLQTGTAGAQLISAKTATNDSAKAIT